MGYERMTGEVKSSRMGALVAAEAGTAVTYGLNNAQQRGFTFIDPGTPVYEGMIVGLHQREKDLDVNICKTKKQTNVRSSTADISVKLTPPIKMSLEDSLDFLAEDEMIEVTPKNMRLRKRILLSAERYKHSRDKAKGR